MTFIEVSTTTITPRGTDSHQHTTATTAAVPSSFVLLESAAVSGDQGGEGGHEVGAEVLRKAKLKGLKIFQSRKLKTGPERVWRPKWVKGKGWGSNLDQVQTVRSDQVR